MQRRDFLRAGAMASLAVPVLSGCTAPGTGGSNDGRDGGDIDAFPYGVASGDPLHDRVILWTALSDANTDTTRNRGVTCQVAEDPDFQTLVVSQVLSTTQSQGYTVKLDAAGLNEDRHYWYRFIDDNSAVSPVGRTRTMPSPGRPTERLRFAIASCSNFPAGFFSVYRMIANRPDIDAVLHLGDYIYEYANGEYGGERVVAPDHEMVTLEDYRLRYATYRKDADLAEVHRIFPMIAVWDDHESTNDSYKDGAESHNEGEGDWETRKQAAIQAYYEWMPIRPAQAADDFGLIYRRFVYGDLVDLMMLDTRLVGRDQQLELGAGEFERFDESRELLGPKQREWLFENLNDSKTQNIRWRVLGQQIMLGQLQLAELPNLGAQGAAALSSVLAFNMDQWDGYAAERLRLLNHVEDNDINNLLVLTGDIHTSWANEIYKNPATLLGDVLNPTPLAAEFVCPSVTSPGFPDGAAELAAVLLRTLNPHIRYAELKTHGFILLDITHERSQAEWYYATDINDESKIGEENGSMAKVATVASADSRTNRIETDGLLSLPPIARNAIFSPITPEPKAKA